VTLIGSASGGRPLLAELRSRKLVPYRAAAGAAVAVGGNQLFDPTSSHVPLCPLHALTGIWCPFCGGLRAVYELTRLNVVSALHYNLVVVAAVPFVLALWLDTVQRARAGHSRRRLPRRLVIAIVVALVAFTVVRNLPIGATWRAG